MFHKADASALLRQIFRSHHIRTRLGAPFCAQLAFNLRCISLLAPACAWFSFAALAMEVTGVCAARVGPHIAQAVRRLHTC